MINYIFELLAFIIAVSSYFKSDIKVMVVWLAATCIFGICGTIGELYEKKVKNKGGKVNG